MPRLESDGSEIQTRAERDTDDVSNWCSFRGNSAARQLHGTLEFERGGIVALSVASGLIPTLSPSLFQYLPAWISPITHTGVALGAIVAFLLNLFFNGTTARKRP